MFCPQHMPSPPLTSVKHLLSMPQQALRPQGRSVGAQHVPEGRQWPCTHAALARQGRSVTSGVAICRAWTYAWDAPLSPAQAGFCRSAAAAYRPLHPLPSPLHIPCTAASRSTHQEAAVLVGAALGPVARGLLLGRAGGLAEARRRGALLPRSAARAAARLGPRGAAPAATVDSSRQACGKRGRSMMAASTSTALVAHCSSERPPLASLSRGGERRGEQLHLLGGRAARAPGRAAPVRLALGVHGRWAGEALAHAKPGARRPAAARAAGAAALEHGWEARLVCVAAGLRARRDAAAARSGVVRTARAFGFLMAAAAHTAISAALTCEPQGVDPLEQHRAVNCP